MTELKNRRLELHRIAVRVRRGWRARAIARGLCAAGCAAALPIALGAVSGAGHPWRILLIWLSIIGGAAAAIRWVFYPLLKPLSDVDAALYLERRAPELNDRFVSAVQLLDEAARGDAPGNASMLLALADEAVAAARALPASRLFVNRRANAAALAALAPALLAMGWMWGPGRETARSFVAPPWTPVRERIVMTRITGAAFVPIGGTFKAEVEFASTPQSFPQFVVSKEGMPPEETRMRRLPGDHAVYTFDVERVAGDFEYRVAAGAFRSKFYRVTAVERPRILSLRLKLEYPAYTEMPPETREENGDIRAPRGTRATIETTASSDLGRAWLEFIPGGRTPMSLRGGRRAAGGFAVTRNVRYRVRMADTHGFTNSDPPVFVVKAAEDGPPEIELLQPSADVKAPKDSAISLKGAARDDYGVSRVTLRWHVLKSKAAGTLPVPIRPAPEALFDFPWDLSRIEAGPGDVVEFTITATDNHRPGAPLSSSTPPRRVTLLSRVEDYREIEAAQQNWVEQMSGVVRDGDAISEKFKQIQRDVAAGTLSGGKKEQDVQRALQRQEQLQKEAADLSNTAQDVLDRMKNNDLISPESLEKIAEIQRLMDSIMTKEMKAAMDKLQEALQKVDLSNADPDMAKRLADQQRINRSLDQTLGRLKRAMAEQKMEMLSKHLSELSDRQKKLVDRIEKLRKGGLTPDERAEADRLSREERDIQKEISSDLDRIDSLAEDMKSEDPRLSESLKKMASDARKDGLDKNLDTAAKSLKEGQMSSASDAARKAKSSMFALSERMNAIKKQYTKQLAEAIKRVIRSVLENTLNLTDTQESLVDRADRLRTRGPESLRAEETAPIAADQRFAQGVAGRISSDISRLSMMTSAIPVTLAGEADIVASDMADAVSLMNDRRAAEAWGEMRRACGGLNRLSLALVTAQDTAGSMPSENEREELMKRLEQLADGQSALNGQTGKAGSLPSSQMGDALSALAMQQRILKQGLGELSQQMRSMGELGERMGQIEKEMAEIEQRLTAGDAGKEVQRRQAATLRRLRDASLSLRRDSDENRRKSEVGRDAAPTAPKAAPAPPRKTLPEAARIEAERQRSQPRPKGYDKVIDAYYEEIMR